MTALIATKFVGEEILDVVKDRFKTAVIEKWTRYRAEQFFNSLVRALAYYDLNLADASFVKEKLEGLFDDEIRTEVFYDAYRQVAFTASKIIGPRIIGILVARLIHFRRRANEREEKILMAAEQLNDGEFDNFQIFFRDVLESAECLAKREFEKKRKYDAWQRKDDGYEIELGSNSSGSSRETRFTLSIDLDRVFGTWAMKLKSIGLFKDVVQETQSNERIDHVEFYTNEVTREQKFFIILPAECHELFKLVCEAKTFLTTESTI
jgi:uncharacterized protein YutD